MILTYKIKHERDFNHELKLAKKALLNLYVFEMGVANVVF